MALHDERAGSSPGSALERGRFPSHHALAAGVVAVALLLLYAPVFVHAVTVWLSDQEFSFGFLLPPLALGLLWQRRDALRRSLGRGWAIGLLPLVCGLLMLVAAARSGVHAIGGVSFVVTTLGATIFLYGPVTARMLLFPTAFLTVSLCLFRGLLNPVGFGLQGLTARYAATTASFAGVPVRRAGVDLFVGQFHFVVTQACSGLSSLVALLCLGTLIVSLTHTSLLRRLALIVLITPIILIANVVRVTLVLALAQVYGLAVARGFLHDFFSLALFLMALGIFCVARSILIWRPPIGATASS